MCYSQKNPLLICYTAVGESNNVEFYIFSFHYYARSAPETISFVSFTSAIRHWITVAQCKFIRQCRDQNERGEISNISSVQLTIYLRQKVVFLPRIVGRFVYLRAGSML